MLHTWIDGIPADAVPVDDRGLNYADGVFETLLCRQGKILGAQLHEARLARGLSRLAFPMQIVGRKPFSQPRVNYSRGWDTPVLPDSP